MVVLRAVARPMLASIFIVQGLDTFLHPDKVAGRAEPVVAPLRERFPALPAKTEDAVRINGAVQMVAGSLLALGRFPRLSALALAATLVPTTAAGHRFWEEEDPATKAQQRIHFLKNLSMLGGLLIAVGDTEGQPSIAWRTRAATQTARKETARTTRRAQFEAARTARSAQQQATRTIQSAQHEAARTVQSARREAVREARIARKAAKAGAKVGAARVQARQAVEAAPRRAAELVRSR
jgi:putative oxidoreductase